MFYTDISCGTNQSYEQNAADWVYARELNVGHTAVPEEHIKTKHFTRRTQPLILSFTHTQLHVSSMTTITYIGGLEF